MKCPNPECRGNLLQKADGITKLRIDGPVTFSGGLAKSRCYWCKAEVEVPVALNLPAAPQPAEPPLVVRVRRRS